MQWSGHEVGMAERFGEESRVEGPFGRHEFCYYTVLFITALSTDVFRVPRGGPTDMKNHSNEVLLEPR